MTRVPNALKAFRINLRRACVLAKNPRLMTWLTAGFLVVLFTGQSPGNEPYRIGANDRIDIRVVGWDTVTLTFVEYSALSGEYVVGLDGAVMLPLLGPVEAAGKTTAELAVEMDEALQTRLGLVEPPSASVAIAAYKPVYLLGDVAIPGAYEFSPGLTVQQAIALAGGIEKFADENFGWGAALRTAGSLREITLNLARQRVRAARLRAEMEGAEGFDIPEEARHPDGPEALTTLSLQEMNLFRSRQEALDRALSALDDSRVLLLNEIEALEEKLIGQARQLELVREQVGNVESLAERGLVRSPALVALQGQLIEMENRELDAETNVFRARQQIADLERDRVDIEASRRLEVLRGLQQAEAEIERLLAQQSTQRQLMIGANALATSQGEEPEIRLEYQITRESPSGVEVLEATPITKLRPSDVLEVEAVELEQSG